LGRYRRLYTRLWSHPAFLQLTEGERLTCVYLLTGRQQNRIGFARMSPAVGAEELNVTPGTFSKRLERVCSAFGWQFDAGARVLLIPSWWRFNDVTNSSHLKGCMSDVAEVPPTPLIERFAAEAMRQLPEPLRPSFVDQIRHRLPNGIAQAVAQAVGDGEPQAVRQPAPHQEQEQEQEQVQVQEPKARSSQSARSSFRAPSTVDRKIRATRHTAPRDSPPKTLNAWDKAKTFLRRHMDVQAFNVWVYKTNLLADDGHVLKVGIQGETHERHIREHQAAVDDALRHVGRSGIAFVINNDQAHLQPGNDGEYRTN